MLNEMLTSSRSFSLKFCETVPRSSDAIAAELLREMRLLESDHWREAMVLILMIVGLTLGALCILGSLSPSAREPLM